MFHTSANLIRNVQACAQRSWARLQVTGSMLVQEKLPFVSGAPRRPCSVSYLAASCRVAFGVTKSGDTIGRLPLCLISRPAAG